MSIRHGLALQGEAFAFSLSPQRVNIKMQERKRCVRWLVVPTYFPSRQYVIATFGGQRSIEGDGGGA